MIKKNRQHFVIRVLVILLFLYSWMSVNIYLPALPTLIHVFHTEPRYLKLSITLFLGGYAVSQLVWGPLSEKHGRKKVLVVGMMITTLGILITLSAINVTVFNIGRLVEALGLGCASVLGRVILVDSLDEMLLLKTMIYGTIVVNVMPAIAPIIGGNLLYFSGWRSIFVFLLVYSVTLLYYFFAKLSETHKNIRPEITVKQMLSDYFLLFKMKRYFGCVLIYMLSSGSMIGYYALAPFLFINRLDFSAHTYGYLALITVASYLLGAFVCVKIAPKFGVNKMILLGTSILVTSALLLAVFSLFYSVNLASVLVPMSVYMFGAAILSPNVNTGAMTESASIAGAGAAIMMFCMYAGAAIFSWIATSLSLNTLKPLAIYVVVVSLLAFAIFCVMVYREAKLNNV